MRLRRTTAPLLSLAALLCLGSPPSRAQTSHADICRLQSSGLTFTMNTFLGQKQPKDVALDQSGLRPGGPRRQLADYAYTRLAAGAKLDAVTAEVNARCLKLDRDALANDDANFDEQDQGAGAQLCADTASSVASFLVEEPGVLTADADKLLDQFTNSRPHDDVNPRPVLRRMLVQAQQQARTHPERQRVADFVMQQCQALKPADRAALDAEFYFAN
jgi:hypothetical protein